MCTVGQLLPKQKIEKRGSGQWKLEFSLFFSKDLTLVTRVLLTWLPLWPQMTFTIVPI